VIYEVKRGRKGHSNEGKKYQTAEKHTRQNKIRALSRLEFAEVKGKAWRDEKIRGKKSGGHRRSGKRRKGKKMKSGQLYFLNGFVDGGW